MATKLLSIRIETELADRLKDEAERDRRTISSYARNLIADALPTKPVGTTAGGSR